MRRRQHAAARSFAEGGRPFTEESGDALGKVRGGGTSGETLRLRLKLRVERDPARLVEQQLGRGIGGAGAARQPRRQHADTAVELANRHHGVNQAELKGGRRVEAVAELEGRVAALAARLASGPRAAYAATKRLLNQSIGATLETQLQAEAERFAACAATPDFAEGVAAFLAKRPARFAK